MVLRRSVSRTGALDSFDGSEKSSSEPKKLATRVNIVGQRVRVEAFEKKGSLGRGTLNGLRSWLAQIRLYPQSIGVSLSRNVSYRVGYALRRLCQVMRCDGCRQTINSKTAPETHKVMN